ncbi:cation diffusion facilitator family transporter [Dethiosulfovibrio salsuginis]|uniref:Cation diffusion facilitator family transporter n=1 Tax=Dethiosulfovibrio salsuginis TaxID=561720 RepID=A0A1X7KQ98_9BACT|nr:cation diffusion facilitator family transporter [Dethiosulfovibrio salsuginis]SMG42904.1 cation diffusion facilitator family transporter [Dethiosulfovibrio salsuginis]
MACHDRASQGMSVSWRGLWIDLGLTLGKILAGFFGNSAAMVADGVHSLSDAVTDIVAIWGFKMVSVPADSSHRYGHGKFETLCSVFVGVALIAAGLGILWASGGRIFQAIGGDFPDAPGMIALVAATISVIVKELLYRYTLSASIRLNSPALKANAWHHRSDAMSSLATLVGIGGAIIWSGWGRVLDPLAGVIVSFMVIKVGWSICFDGADELMEASLPEEISREIVGIGEAVEGVRDLHGLRTRRIGASVAMDFHLLVDPDLSVREGHDIATAVEEVIRDRFGEDTIISVHLEPDERGGAPLKTHP